MMEYVEGRTLAEELQEGPLPETQGEEKTGDVVELLEIPDGVILKYLGYGRKGSIPHSVIGCAANQGR